MSKESIESEIALYIKEHFRDLSFSGQIRGKEIESIKDISVSIDRQYDGKGNYQFSGQAEVYIKIDNDKYGENYTISGVAYVEEGENSPLIKIIGPITLNSKNRL